MKKILRFTTHLLLASVMAFTGCTSSDEDLDILDETIYDNAIDGEGTLVTFSLEVADMEGDEEDDATRAVSSNDSTIANLWILQYDSSGTRVYSKYITSGFTDFDLLVYPTASTIVFVANTSSGTFGTSTSTETLSALGSATYSVTANDGVLNNSYCIMSGSISISSISASTTNTLKLQRNAAKVNVKIVNNLSSSDWTLASVETLNIQTNAYYYPGDYSSSTYFPTTSSAVDYTWSSDEVTSGTGDGLTIYLPINKRGTVPSNSTESDKTANTLTGATAIRINFGSLVTPLESLSYTFYLGADMIDDYNLLGDYYYNCTFTLNGSGVSDYRVAIGNDYYYTFYNDDATDNQKLFNIGISYVDSQYGTMTYSEATGTYYPDSNATTTGCIPTRQELMAMWIFKGSDSFTSSYYWSVDLSSITRAPSSDKGSYWYALSFSDGITSTSSTSNYYARPIKVL